MARRVLTARQHVTSVSPPPSSPTVAPASAANAEQWFKQEVHAHDGQLKAYLSGTYPAIRPNVEDVVQESYLRVWKVRTTREIVSAKAFLFTIARNLTLNLLRGEKRARLIPGGELALSGVIDESPSAVDRLTHQEKIDLLTDALAALPDKTRAILLLHKFQGLTQAETARQLNLSLKTVEHQVTRGVERCTRYLRDRGYDLS